jgi:DNA-binding SARP family transcriptional activator
MLEVRLLGQFDVRCDGEPIVIPSRPAQSLFAYLLLNAGIPQRREKLAGLLWPDATEVNARSNLRFQLWRLRKAIETESGSRRPETYLLADDITIAFDTNADYRLDLSILECAASERAATGDLISLLSLYRGELLPGFYEDWVVLERERLQAIFEQQVQRLLDKLVEEQRWGEVLEWGERWIAFGQTPEPAYRALMLDYSARGDLSKVVSTYQRCVESLRKELDVEPSEQTQALLARLTRGEKIMPALPPPATSVVPPSAHLRGDEPPAPGEPPFKGLQYFEEADADLFFGREALTAKLVGHLRQERFLAVVSLPDTISDIVMRAFGT